VRFERVIVVVAEFTTSDRPFALARRLAAAGNLTVEVLYGVLDDDHGEGIPGGRLQRRLDAAPRVSRQRSVAPEAEELRPLERRILQWRADGADHAEIGRHFRRSAEHVERIEQAAGYKLAR
jgi:hypothetical protein